MTATSELGDRMARVTNLVRLMVTRDEHERFLDYAIEFEFEGEESQLPTDVRKMLLDAEEKSENPLPLLIPRAYIG